MSLHNRVYGQSRRDDILTYRTFLRCGFCCGRAGYVLGVICLFVTSCALVPVCSCIGAPIGREFVRGSLSYLKGCASGCAANTGFIVYRSGGAGCRRLQISDLDGFDGEAMVKQLAHREGRCSCFTAGTRLVIGLLYSTACIIFLVFVIFYLLVEGMWQRFSVRLTASCTDGLFCTGSGAACMTEGLSRCEGFCADCAARAGFVIDSC